MATRFEVVLENGNSFYFQLRNPAGEVMLRSLGSSSKIMTQNEILHARNSLREPDRLVPHDDDGHFFLVLKDRDGSVLAKSPRVEDRATLEQLMQDVQAAASAPIVDLTKRASGVAPAT